MALVDVDYMFVFMDVAHYGSNGDSGIFITYPLGQAFMQGNLKIPGPKRLPGWATAWRINTLHSRDEAFPSEWI